MQPEPDYEVGYKKPPKEHQFKKGQSGNPKGRPRKSLTLASALNGILDEKVTISENGRRQKITKLEAAFKQVVNGAVKGDPKAAQTMLRYMEMVLRNNRLAKPTAKPAQQQWTILSMPDNGRGPIDDELKRRFAKVQHEYDQEKRREREGHPANEDWGRGIA